MGSWLRSLTRTWQQAQTKRRVRHSPPALEQLEGRCLLAVNLATQVAGPNIDASNLSGYQGETTIAINPTNPSNMIAGSNNLGSGSNRGYTEAYWTKDGGNTWTAVNLGGKGDPGVAFDRIGNAYFSFIDSKNGISVRKSTNGGVTWGAAVQVAARPRFGGLQDKPALTVGPDHSNPALDRIYVAWDDTGIGDVVKVSSSGDGGKHWTMPVQVDGQANEIYAQPAVGPNGELYLAWDNFGTSGQSSLMVSRSLDNGATFSPPVVAAISTVNLFNPGYFIPAQNSRGIAADPSLVVEQGVFNPGRIYMTYTTASTLHDDTNIELIFSDDSGASWSSPVQVNDDITPNSQFCSAIAIDPTNGSVNLAWYDARNDLNNKQVDVYFQSYDSAGTPSGGNVRNVKVTTAPSDETTAGNANQYGDYMGIAAYGGYAFPVWTDHRNSNVSGSEEIYVDPPLPIPGPAEATAPAVTSQDSGGAFPDSSLPPASAQPLGGMAEPTVSRTPLGPLVPDYSDSSVSASRPVNGSRNIGTDGQFVLVTAAPAQPLGGMAAPTVSRTPFGPLVPASLDSSVSPSRPVNVSRTNRAGNTPLLTTANDPLLSVPTPNLEATPPIRLPVASDAPFLAADPEATAWRPGMPSVLPPPAVPTQPQAAWQQACDACFAGDNQTRTPLDQGPAMAPAFPDGPPAALYLTALMAGFAAALNGFEEVKKIDPRWAAAPVVALIAD